jgi:hypothetical protein
MTVLDVNIECNEIKVINGKIWRCDSCAGHPYGEHFYVRS